MLFEAKKAKFREFNCLSRHSEKQDERFKASILGWQEEFY
jgi:hypothetical protein